MVLAGRRTDDLDAAPHRQFDRRARPVLRRQAQRTHGAMTRPPQVLEKLLLVQYPHMPSVDVAQITLIRMT